MGKIKIIIMGDGKTKTIECDRYFLSARDEESKIYNESNFKGSDICSLAYYLDAMARLHSEDMIIDKFENDNNEIPKVLKDLINKVKAGGVDVREIKLKPGENVADAITKAIKKEAREKNDGEPRSDSSLPLIDFNAIKKHRGDENGENS